VLLARKYCLVSSKRIWNIFIYRLYTLRKQKLGCHTCKLTIWYLKSFTLTSVSSFKSVTKAKHWLSAGTAGQAGCPSPILLSQENGKPHTAKKKQHDCFLPTVPKTTQQKEIKSVLHELLALNMQTIALQTSWIVEALNNFTNFVWLQR